ncbi:MAG: hypothetical protein DHS20C11_30470 [Lysobacteraceae bacterium]|nr:MAG: hypothetical protein DHS20C11_30470 [Xanthomonadaceae bacterium]
MTTFRYILAFVLGAACSFGLAAVVVQIIKAIAPHEHMLIGLVGTLVAFVAMPTLGVIFTLWLGRPKPGTKTNDMDD